MDPDPTAAARDTGSPAPVPSTDKDPRPWPASLRPVPAPRGRKVFLFGLLTALEFVGLTLVFGQTSFVGTWSAIGNAVFLLWMGAFLAGVLLPLYPWLREAWSTGRARQVFWALFVVSFVMWFAGIGSLQPLTAGASDNTLHVVPLNTAFGLFPSAIYSVGPIQGFVNLQNVLVFAALSWAWASVVAIEVALRTRRPACAVGSKSPSGKAAGSLLVWTPLLGLSSGCCSAPLVEFVLIGVLPAAGPSFTAFRDLNWIWDGLLEIASAAALSYLVGKTTRFAALTATDADEDSSRTSSPTPGIPDTAGSPTDPQGRA